MLLLLFSNSKTNTYFVFIQCFIIIITIILFQGVVKIQAKSNPIFTLTLFSSCFGHPLSYLRLKILAIPSLKPGIAKFGDLRGNFQIIAKIARGYPKLIVFKRQFFKNLGIPKLNGLGPLHLSHFKNQGGVFTLYPLGYPWLKRIVSFCKYHCKFRCLQWLDRFYFLFFFHFVFFFFYGLSPLYSSKLIKTLESNAEFISSLTPPQYIASNGLNSNWFSLYSRPFYSSLDLKCTSFRVLLLLQLNSNPFWFHTNFNFEYFALKNQISIKGINDFSQMETN